MRPGIIALIMGAVLWASAHLGITAPLHRLCGIALCFLLTAALIWAIGLTRNERRKILKKII